jgi:hypothetical protein
MNNADIQLSQETCKKLHSRPWAPVVIDEIPLTTMGADGLYTHTTVTPYRLGENLYTIQVGSVDNEGYCTGGGMTFHGLEYDRERATATLRIKLSKRRLALGEQDSRGFKCDPLKHKCTYPGGIMFWETKPCPAVAIYVHRNPVHRRRHLQNSYLERGP